MKKQFIVATWLSFSIMIALSSVRSLSAVRSAGPAIYMRDAPTAIVETLSTERTNFVVGGDIRVTVRTTNTSVSDILLLHVGPAINVHIEIRSENGRAISPNVPRQSIIWSSGFPQSPLSAGTSVVETRSSSGQTSMSLKEWGYDLRSPGTYYITAYRYSNGEESMPSNTVKIRILSASTQPNVPR